MNGFKTAAKSSYPKVGPSSLNAAKSSNPKVGPVSSLHQIAANGYLHGKDACVVKLKIIAPLSSMNFPFLGDVHSALVNPPMQSPS